MDKKYDVILVGAGPAGIFSAYELIKKDPTLKVLLVEKGNDIYSRKCPILAKKAVLIKRKLSLIRFCIAVPRSALSPDFTKF